MISRKINHIIIWIFRLFLLLFLTLEKMCGGKIQIQRCKNCFKGANYYNNFLWLQFSDSSKEYYYHCRRLNFWKEKKDRCTFLSFLTRLIIIRRRYYGRFGAIRPKWCHPFFEICDPLPRPSHPFYLIGLWSNVTFWQIPPLS